MKNKGFTLIELLAVLAILAVLALLITPTVFETVKRFRGEAYNNQVSAIEMAGYDFVSDKLALVATSDGNVMYITIGDLKANGYLNKNLKNPQTNKLFPNDALVKITKKRKDYKVEYVNDSGTDGLSSNLESQAPSIKLVGSEVIKLNLGDIYVDPGYTGYDINKNNVTPTVSIIYKEGTTTVSSIDTSADKIYTVFYKIVNGGITQVVTRNIIIGSPRTYPMGEVIYFNPETNTKCNKEAAVSLTNTKTGCMKWYVYNDQGTSVRAILDHNTTAQVAYNSTGSNISMNELAIALASDTASWNASLNSRLINADEVAAITGNTSFVAAASTSNNGFYLDTNTTNESPTCAPYTNISDCKYGWLYDRTHINCVDKGCLNNSDKDTGGYWTSSPVAASSNYAWIIYNYGKFRFNNVNDTFYGIRPVINILKVNLK